MPAAMPAAREGVCAAPTVNIASHVSFVKGTWANNAHEEPCTLTK